MNEQSHSSRCSNVDKLQAGIDECVNMPRSVRNSVKNVIMQDMLNNGINAFGIELLCESVLKMDDPIPLDFLLPIGREDCKEWAGCRIQITPLKAANDR